MASSKNLKTEYPNFKNFLHVLQRWGVRVRPLPAAVVQMLALHTALT